MRRSRFPITYQITEQHNDTDDQLPTGTPSLVDHPSNATNPAVRTPSGFSIASTANTDVTHYTYSTINTSPSLQLHQSNTRDNISEEDAIFQDMLTEILRDAPSNNQLPNKTPKMNATVFSNDSDMSNNELLVCLDHMSQKEDDYGLFVHSCVYVPSFYKVSHCVSVNYFRLRSHEEWIQKTTQNIWHSAG